MLFTKAATDPGTTSEVPWGRRELVMLLDGPAYDLYYPEELWGLRMHLSGRALVSMHTVLSSVPSTKKSKQREEL